VKRVLDPLARIPGVRRALLISRDGVPITHLSPEQPAATKDERAWSDSAEDESAFAGMVTSLLNEVHRSVDPLSWDRPKRLVMRAARGTLVLLVTERVTISVELVRGMAAEELRLPMEAVLARMERATTRDTGEKPTFTGALPSEEPPGLFPGAEHPALDTPSTLQLPTGNEVPETTTEN
jgi:predicted regulator of Ras-like GTPase activity (Roadblock/LC7/MglB family)